MITLPNGQPDTSIQKGKPKQKVVALIRMSIDEKWAKSESLITLPKGQQNRFMQKGKLKQVVALNGVSLDETLTKSEQIY